MASERRLGQGLALLLGETRASDVAATSGALLEIPVDRIDAEPAPAALAPRRRSASRNWSIPSVVTAIVQPVVVRRRRHRRGELIAGERRWRAAHRGRPGDDPRRRARGRRPRRRWRSRWSRTSSRADLEPRRDGARLRAPDRRVRALPDRGGRDGGRPQPHLGRQHACACSTCPTRCSRRSSAASSARATAARSSPSDGHDERRALGRLAVDRGLSVRATEAAARKAGKARSAPRPRRAPDRLRRRARERRRRRSLPALGVPARVVPQAEGCRIELAIADRGRARDASSSGSTSSAPERSPASWPLVSSDG